MHQGPWIFRELMVIIEEYDGKGRPGAVQLDRTHVWAQIHDLPELFRSQAIADQLARRIGQVKSVEMNPTRLFEGNYVRVRAKIKVDEPLTRFVPLNLNGKERIILPIKYEKIGFFCEVCGILGHIKEECGYGVHSPEEIEYGTWMIATRRNLPSNQGFARGTPSAQGGTATARGTRGRGHNAGRGAAYVPRKRTSGDAGLQEDGEDLDDAAQSPLKPQVEEAEEKDLGGSDARSKINLSGVKGKSDVNATVSGGNGGEPANNNANATPLGGAAGTPPPPPEYVKPRDRKKLKDGPSPIKERGQNKSANEKTTDDLATSAASLGEDRRA